jgi:hypothetical protein
LGPILSQIISLHIIKPYFFKTHLNIVTCIPIARQRLAKHIPAKRMRAAEGCPLLGNGPVSTSP